MIILAGCQTQPLGSYLTGLGAWHAICRLPGGDPYARAAWHAGCLMLDTSLDVDEMVKLFCHGFGPLPIVSPWNQGSGFAGNGKSREAERALEQVRASEDPRFARLRQAVLAADRVVEAGRGRGWSGSGGEMWDKEYKRAVIQLCRNQLPDDAVAWVDTAAVLTTNTDSDAGISYNRLLGTGGNFGRQELQATYVQRALSVLLDPRQSRHSEGWLRAALFGTEGTPYLRETVGQFDPGRAGGIQSSPREKGDDKGFANPWVFLLLIEGVLLFAAAAVRRHGAEYAGAAVPFVLRPSPVGYGSAAEAENATAEIWAPQWHQPATLAEIRHLLGEGRLEWNDRAARTGLDAARAVATLGVDRGITGFTRHVIAERLGQNPLAVPVGQVTVPNRRQPPLLREFDAWLGRLNALAQQSPGLPQGIAALQRRLESAMYQAATRRTATDLRDVLVATGYLHHAVAQSTSVRERLIPLHAGKAGTWWSALAPPGEIVPSELRVAAALASGRDHIPARYLRDAGPAAADAARRHPPHALRRLCTPVRLDLTGRYLTWSDTTACPLTADPIGALGAAHRRRSLAGAIHDPTTTGRHANDQNGNHQNRDGQNRDDQTGEADHADHQPEAHPHTSMAIPEPAVRGVYGAFAQAARAGIDDVQAMLAGTATEFRDDLLADYLRGLLLLRWPPAGAPAVGLGASAMPNSRSRTPVHPALALLLPFYGTNPLHVRLDRDGDHPQPILLRPGAQWIPQLQAGAVTTVLQDAAARLRAAGLPGVIDPGPWTAASIDGPRLAAALLVPVHDSDRLRALRQVITEPVPARGGESDSAPSDNTSHHGPSH